MKLHILICTVIVLSYGSTIGRPGYEKRSNALDFFKVVKDAAKAKLLEGLDGGTHENDDPAGQDGGDELNDEDDEENEDDESDDEDEEVEAEVYDDENPSNRYNAGKMSQLRVPYEMGVSQFEVEGRNLTSGSSEIE